MLGDPLLAIRDLATLLDGLGVAWAVTGSVASSLHGVPRATNDVDVLAFVAPRLADVLAGSAAFEVDPDHVRDALNAGQPCNIFHRATAVKVDLYAPRDAFARSEIRRAVVVDGVRLVSAEDVILAKLRWYRATGEQSDRQWRDVLGVLAVQAGRLDVERMEGDARELGVGDLLTRARATPSAGI